MDFWKLPEVIQRAVRDHHQPAADPDGKSGEIPLSYVVDAANQFVNSQGLSIIENLPGESPMGRSSRVWASIRIRSRRCSASTSRKAGAMAAVLQIARSLWGGPRGPRPTPWSATWRRFWRSCS